MKSLKTLIKENLNLSTPEWLDDLMDMAQEDHIISPAFNITKDEKTYFELSNGIVEMGFINYNDPHITNEMAQLIKQQFAKKGKGDIPFGYHIKFYRVSGKHKNFYKYFIKIFQEDTPKPIDSVMLYLPIKGDGFIHDISRI